jgi:hypothetical protein
MTDALKRLVALGRTASDRALLDRALGELAASHRLAPKIAAEPNLAGIMTEFVTRLVDAFGSLSAIRGQAILDIACGSSSSRSPVTGRQTSEFEPWMCRLLLELGAHPVGLDIGAITDEAFEHHRVDLGVPGALDFLATESFDGPSMRAGSLVHPSFVLPIGTTPNAFVARSTARSAACYGQAGLSSTATVGLALGRSGHPGGRGVPKPGNAPKPHPTNGVVEFADSSSV